MVGETSGVATSTVARRLSAISGFFAYLQARGDIDATRCHAGCPAAANEYVPHRASR